jgi:hypothetical protein
MRKLKLDVEELRVDAFVTEGAPDGEGGTVRGFNHTRNNHATCGFQYTCVAELTCYQTCGETCKCTTVTQPEVTCLYECPSEICTPTCV